MPGGGGFGNPLDRDPARVAADVAAGYVSTTGARADYGVVLKPATGGVDQAQTDNERQRRRTDA